MTKESSAERMSGDFAPKLVADLKEQIDAYRDLSTSLVLDDLQPTRNRR